MLTSTNTLTFEFFSELKQAVFVIIPENTEGTDIIASLLYIQLLTMSEKDYDVAKLSKTRHTRFIVDEHVDLSHTPQLDFIMATIRQKKISVNLITESMAQRNEEYETNFSKMYWGVLMANCDAALLLNSDSDTIDALIRTSARKTTNSDEASMAKEQLMDTTKCYVKIRGESLYIGEKFGYSK